MLACYACAAYRFIGSKWPKMTEKCEHGFESTRVRIFFFGSKSPKMTQKCELGFKSAKVFFLGGGVKMTQNDPEMWTWVWIRWGSIFFFWSKSPKMTQKCEHGFPGGTGEGVLTRVPKMTQKCEHGFESAGVRLFFFFWGQNHPKLPKYVNMGSQVEQGRGY